MGTAIVLSASGPTQAAVNPELIGDVGDYKYRVDAAETANWKLCNGQDVSRTVYSALFAKISTAFGVGDNSTTFNLPDMRGRVPGGSGQGVFTSTFASTDVLVAANDITVASNRSMYTGTAVVLSTTGTAPAGLTAGTTYYAIRDSATQVSLATTLANALAGTAIDITSQGTGNHTLTVSYTNWDVGNRAGEETHGLTVAEMPSHTHTTNDSYAVQNASDALNTNVTATDEITRDETTSATGGSTSHNVMQPTVFAGHWMIKVL